MSDARAVVTRQLARERQQHVGLGCHHTGLQRRERLARHHTPRPPAGGIGDGEHGAAVLFHRHDLPGEAEAFLAPVQIAGVEDMTQRNSSLMLTAPLKSQSPAHSAAARSAVATCQATAATTTPITRLRMPSSPGVPCPVYRVLISCSENENQYHIHVGDHSERQALPHKGYRTTGAKRAAART
jgi:hypothetical protein